MNPFEEAMRLVIGYLIPVVEACGVLVVTLGVARAIVRYVRCFVEHDPLQIASLRLQLGQSMVMGLEFQVAADILKTALSPTLNEVTLLVALIAVRTVLNYVLQRELRVLSAVCDTPDGENSVGNRKDVISEGTGGGKHVAWYVYLAHFCAGLFLANGVPHFVNGISGRRFKSVRFASWQRGIVSPSQCCLGDGQFPHRLCAHLRRGGFCGGLNF